MNLANQLIMPPMATAKAGPDEKVRQALPDYYEEKSRCGHISLITIERSYIIPEGKANGIYHCDFPQPDLVNHCCTPSFRSASRCAFIGIRSTIVSDRAEEDR